MPIPKTHDQGQDRRSGFALHCTQALVSILILLVALIAHRSHAIETVHYTGDKVSLLPLLEFVSESKGETLDDILVRPESDWHHRQSINNNLGQTSDPIWARVRLSGISTAFGQPIVRLNYPHHDYVDFYLFERGRLIRHFTVGDQLTFDSRPVDQRTFWFPLDDASADEQEIYIRISTPGPLLMPLDLMSYKEAAEEEKLLYLWAGAFLGIIAIMALYNLFLYFSLRESSYILYVIYLLSAGVMQGTMFGFGTQYFWGSNPGVNNQVIAFLAPFVQLTAMAFVLKFVDLRNFGSILDRSVANLLIFVLVVMCIASFTVPYSLIVKLGHSIALFGVICAFYVGIKGWIMGMKSARMFTIAWFAHLVFIGWYLLDMTGKIPATEIGNQAFALGFIAELSLLSIAFADKMNQEKELRINSQTKLLDMQVAMNQELDNKVKERTAALEKANRRLEELSVTDGLTKLFNRRYFDQVFRDHYEQSYKDQHPISVMMVDIDFFKKLNDNYGHAFGDLCLVRAAQLIRKVVTMPGAFAARYGGEEFVVVLPKTTEDRAAQVGEMLRKAFEQTTVTQGKQSKNMTISIGVACTIPSQPGLEEKLLSVADACLYQSKENGRNQVTPSEKLAGQ
ncbi:diguanylate cyclase [Thalassolituus sp.]|uniref:sensor domain-containing diguanylate cyclase n=2 Tax=Thalassolituus sp. TaxID=2030822 RepID=UPI0035187FC8